MSGQIKDPAQKSEWQEALSKTIAEHETLQVTVSGKTTDQRDPCADAIAAMLAVPEVKK